MSAALPARRTPGELLRERGQLSHDTVAARLDGRIVDLHTPVPENAEVAPITASDPAALQVIRHSAAHAMAEAVQRLFPGTQVTIGPAIEQGFYYDFDRPDGPFTDKDLEAIEAEMRRIIKAKKPFYREELDRDAAHRLFESMGEKYKLELLSAIPAGEAISIYRHGSPERPDGSWIDLCEGPHVPHTGHLGAVKLTSVAGAYWRGDEHNPMLQRIYGTAFPSEAELKEHLRLLEEARQRDHRKLGKELGLFSFHEYAPGMPFFLPRGATVYRRLLDLIRSVYGVTGYEEVITPQIFDKRLFKTSGHIENFVDNMYLAVTKDALEEARAKNEEPEWTAQKPMNCPSHCLIFGDRRRSYRELPWRVADFGRLHRFERAGVVHGLARVRSFCQDDAHIFCTPEQLESEIAAFNRLLFDVYKVFGFEDVRVKLALRPEKKLGDDELWDRAEGALAKALNDAAIPFESLAGEGAFYGPKLEFHVTDALKRSWQLGTIQLDYMLPERFGLEYIGSDGAGHRPIMLHRAIFGSLERFYAIYLEHVAGKFPVWAAPEQAILVTVSERQAEYAESVRREFVQHGLRMAIDVSSDKLGAKIRSARLMRHPYIVVIGDDEVQHRQLSPRSRDAGELGKVSVEEFLQRLLEEAKLPRITTAS
jgi:threonyl-tRNA synthetase